MTSIVRHRLSDSQLQALSEIPAYQQSVIKLSEKLPASHYIDPARFELEKAAIFFREPMMVGPSCHLPKPNTYFSVDILNVPVLLTRDKGGEVRAFVNMCTHRGTTLCPRNETTMEGSRISCPYHAWTFTLNGQLMGVPREDVFIDFDKSKHSLVSLPCVEAGGLIYVGLKSGANVDFSEVTGDLAEDLKGMGMHNMHVYRKTTYKVEANWKLLMDTMLDKYHVQRLHQNTLAKFFDDTPEISHMVGPHVRSTSGRVSFSADDRSEDFEVVRRTSVFGYALYPQGAIVVSPRYVSLCVMRPVSASRTDVDFIMLITDPPANAEAEEKLAQSWDLMDISFGKEDFWAAELGQKGLSTGALEHVLLGGLEKRIQMFHEVIEARVRDYQRGVGKA